MIPVYFHHFLAVFNSHSSLQYAAEVIRRAAKHTMKIANEIANIPPATEHKT